MIEEARQIALRSGIDDLKNHIQTNSLVRHKGVVSLSTKMQTEKDCSMHANDEMTYMFGRDEEQVKVLFASRFHLHQASVGFFLIDDFAAVLDDKIVGRQGLHVAHTPATAHRLRMMRHHDGREKTKSKTSQLQSNSYRRIPKNMMNNQSKSNPNELEFGILAQLHAAIGACFAARTRLRVALHQQRTDRANQPMSVKFTCGHPRQQGFDEHSFNRSMIGTDLQS